ncbi:hypothetical protein Tco_0067086 [Tanacetum coccineum]
MSYLKFADTHNLVAFLEKPTESEGFKEIVDFLNANPIKYALTVNPIIYLDKKKVIITKSTIKRDLQLEDANGVDCLLNASIFEQLTLIGYEKLSQKLTFYKAFFSPQWKFLIHTILQCLSAKSTAWTEFSSTMASAIICLATNQKFNFSKYIFDNMVKNADSMVKFWMYPRFVQVFVNKQVGDMSHHKRIYVTPSHTKKIFRNMRREGKGFSGRVTPLFQTMMVQAHEEMGKGLEIPIDPHHTPIITQPSSSQPQRKQKSRKSKKKNTKVPRPSGSTDNVPDENVPTTSNDPLLSGEDRLKLTELMDLCTNLQKKVLDLEKAKTAQDSEIASLKKKVKKLERRNKSRTMRLKRLRKGRKIAYIDADVEVTLIDETQGRNDDNLMFDTGVLDEQEVKVEKVVSTAEVTSESATTTIVNELTLAQTLIEIKAAKPKVRGVMIQDPSEFTTTTTTTTPAALKPSQDKGKAKMNESEKPLKKKDQIMYNQEDMFDKAFKRVNTFVDYKTELVKGSEKRAEDSTKRTSTKLEQEVDKKQKINNAKVDDDQEEAKMKELMNIVPDEEEVAINAIPLATKPPCIADWKIIKEGKISQFQIIKADGSSKRYSAFIHMLRNFDKEDLETLWKLVKANHGSTRPEEGYNRVLWGDLMIMFEPDIESPVWRTLQNEKVLIWKLFDSCRVHFLRLQSMHIFMLVEKSFLSSSQNSSRILEVFESILLLMLLVYKLLLLVFRVNVDGIKLQLLTELQLLMDKD